MTNLLSMAGMTSRANTLVFSSQGDRVAAGLEDGRVHVWELRKRTPSRKFGSASLSAPPPYQQAPMAERLRLASEGKSSMLISSQRPDEIVGRPFYPKEWYERAREALPTGLTTGEFQPFRIERPVAVLVDSWRYELSKRMTAAGRSGWNVSINSMRP